MEIDFNKMEIDFNKIKYELDELNGKTLLISVGTDKDYSDRFCIGGKCSKTGKVYLICDGYLNQVEEINELKEKINKLRKDAKEAVNTTWRFINSYEKFNTVPIILALKSVKYHLKKIDYIFDDKSMVLQEKSEKFKKRIQ